MLSGAKEEQGGGRVLMSEDWKPPPKGYVLMNTDAGLHNQTRRGGWGVVARKEDGALIGAGAESEKKKGDPVVEEALAIRLAVNIAKQNGWTKVIIQSDCKALIDMINRKSAEVPSTGVIIFDILKLSKELSEYSFSFIRKEGNCVAHQSAKFAITLIDKIEWKEYFPDWLNSLARSDVGAGPSVL